MVEVVVEIVVEAGFPRPQRGKQAQSCLLFHVDSLTNIEQPFRFSPNFTHTSPQRNSKVPQYGSPLMALGMIHNNLLISTAGGTETSGGDGVLSMNAMAMGTFDQKFNNVPQDLWKMPKVFCHDVCGNPAASL